MEERESKFKRKNTNIQEWAKGAYHVVEGLLKANMQSVLEENFQIERSPDVYIEIIRSLALENLDKEVIKYFAPSEPEEIIHAIIENVKQRKITEGWAKAINYMIVIGPNWPWENFIQGIDTFTRNTAITFKEWKEVLEALWYIKQLQEMESTVNTVLEKISKDGRAFHYLYESFNNNDWKTVAWNLMTILAWNPQIEHYSKSKWNYSINGQNIIKQLLSNPNNYNNYNKNKILHVFITLLKKFSQFKDFYIGLEKITKSQWLEALKKQNMIFDLLQILISEGTENLNLKYPFSDALKKWAGCIIRNNKKIKSFDKYNELYNALDESTQLIFWRDLRNFLICISSYYELSPILNLYGKKLISSGVLSEEADKIIRKGFRNIIERKIDTEIKWMIDVLKKDGKFIENIKTPTLKDFLDRLKGLSELPEDLQEQIKDIENRIELELKKREETSD